LRRAAPDARLLLLLRDPVERFRSGLDHLDRMGAPPDGTAIADAVQRGFYFRALEGWLDQFEPGQLLVLQHERCVADRDGQLEATFRHLGLPPHRPPASDQPARAPAGPRRALDDDVRRYLTALYAPDVIALAENHSGLDLALWPNFAYLTGSTDPPAPGPNSPTRRP
jgi:hypothetical protein